MDDIYVYLLGGAIIAIVIIVLNHKKQKGKVDTFLQQAKQVQPVFMQASVDKKIKTLKVALYGNGNGVQLETAIIEGAALNAIQAKKQSFINQFNKLEQGYAAGSISLETYDHQLHELIMQING